ncbi:hypothetical protein, partial [Pantoea dispersa]|uniref:hypothetical protein n=1 Tax=Pantoea dispersa TaxID=59814 RepID=UPI0019D39E43
MNAQICPCCGFYRFTAWCQNKKWSLNSVSGTEFLRSIPGEHMPATEDRVNTALVSQQAMAGWWCGERGDAEDKKPAQV